ncbi:MEKHLA domain-containing protein [Croceibacterium aestuarii]|uniref:MEKHLA domain-containing protein n=1 Tax=Croceibacterium aestuarii TaxID=3064139 RepID=UPI00272E40B7|nr:MEKHLA domain-containing protein [Croceibacterium sp. D39]
MDDRAKVQASAGERLALIARSFQRLTGQPLAATPNPLWNAPRAILAHGIDVPPRFFYGNRLALELFAMSADRFIGLPSYESAEADAREERTRTFGRLETDDIVTGYGGVRIAANGMRFRIDNAIIWNLRDDAGVLHGQAATFTDWSPL